MLLQVGGTELIFHKGNGSYPEVAQQSYLAVAAATTAKARQEKTDERGWLATGDEFTFKIQSSLSYLIRASQSRAKQMAVAATAAAAAVVYTLVVAWVVVWLRQPRDTSSSSLS